MAHIRADLSSGRRLYIQTAYGEPIVDRLKEVGAHWDKEVRCWWISPTKKAAIEDALVAADEKEDEAKALGLPPPAEDPDKVRLYGKAMYKGRAYYVRVVKDGRARLTTLDGELDFWAPCVNLGVRDERPDVAFITKVYEVHTRWNGQRGRYSKEIPVYTTLGSIRRFIEKQKDPATRRVQCQECEAWFDEGGSCRECGGC